jgi:indole-3-glycerol phosphate synthase
MVFTILLGTLGWKAIAHSFRISTTYHIINTMPKNAIAIPTSGSAGHTSMKTLQESQMKATIMMQVVEQQKPGW